MQNNIIDYQKVEDIIGYVFQDKSLLEAAFTHPSYANEHSSQSYERLEFLGDAVAKCIIADELFARFPRLSEGKLTRMKANIESNTNFSKFFMPTGLSDYVRFGKNSQDTLKLYAKLFEAITGAIFLDSNKDLYKTRQFVLMFLGDAIDKATITKDPKSMLLEQCQKKRKKCLFELKEEIGRAANDPLFTADVFIDGKKHGTGSGRTKKDAEQMAAEKALKGFLSID